MESTNLPLCACPNTLLFGHNRGEEGCGCERKYRHDLGLMAIQQLLLTFKEFKEELAEFRLANPNIDNATHEQAMKTLSSKPCYNVNICDTMHESIQDSVYALAWFQRTSGIYGPELVTDKYHGWHKDCNIGLQFPGLEAVIKLLESWSDDLRQTLGDYCPTSLPDRVLRCMLHRFGNKHLMQLPDDILQDILIRAYVNK
eukprot:3649306-Rhodomonas_salina.1